jgi:hypothetical protein
MWRNFALLPGEKILIKSTKYAEDVGSIVEGVQFALLNWQRAQLDANANKSPQSDGDAEGVQAA